MGLTTKIILGAGILTYLYWDTLFGKADTKEPMFTTSPYIGLAVTSPNSEFIYKINWQGFKVRYENTQAYLNDGLPEVINMTDEELNLLGEVTNAMIFETGGYIQY
jgi:hypothetical protein